MKHQTRARAGIAVVTVLAADAVAHLYWMTGSTWPARDAGSLSRAVLNFVVPFTPRVLLVPLALLLAAATLVLIAMDRPAWLGRRIPGALKRLGAWAVATGLLVRGVAGLVWAFGIGASLDTPFYWLNLLVYEPVCLALFAGTVIVSRLPRAVSRTDGMERSRPSAPLPW
ncbi:DUF3995 domain-containing protein [Nonomuraea sp. NPDC049784]|uniref:DUF3995 domain-containing protein n=1 Tax=Nonomuraea sp. NPDC049784 TaxID=3154361 RepID=UPI0033D4969B